MAESMTEYTVRLWHRDGRVEDETFRASNIESAVNMVSAAFHPVRAKVINTREYK